MEDPSWNVCGMIVACDDANVAGVTHATVTVQERMQGVGHPLGERQK